MIHPIKHDNGKSDLRYTVDKEFCSYEEERFVARFCEEWIGQSIDKDGAIMACQKHKASNSEIYTHYTHSGVEIV